MSSTATFITENFPIYHLEAKTQLIQDLPAHFSLKLGDFPSRGGYKGKLSFYLIDTSQKWTQECFYSSYNLQILYVKMPQLSKGRLKGLVFCKLQIIQDKLF